MTTERILEAMLEYDKGDLHNINHFMKVFAYASTIGRLEGLDERTQETLEIAALMHDIGVKVCRAKYGNSNGKNQEKEGPIEAKPLLEKAGVDSNMAERVMYLIAHHHTYDNIDGMDYQILVEADFLVNFDEMGSTPESRAATKEKLFKTEAGINMLEKMYL